MEGLDKVKLNVKKLKKTGTDTGILAGGYLAQYYGKGVVSKIGLGVTIAGVEGSIHALVTDRSGAVKPDQVSATIAKAMPRSSGLGNVPLLPPMTQYNTQLPAYTEEPVPTGSGAGSWV